VEQSRRGRLSIADAQKLRCARRLFKPHLEERVGGGNDAGERVPVNAVKGWQVMSRQEFEKPFI
jgi:hypothetical protein